MSALPIAELRVEAPVACPDCGHETSHEYLPGSYADGNADWACRECGIIRRLPVRYGHPYVEPTT